MSHAARRGVPEAPAVVAAIALNTFREAIRDRVLYLLLVFALIIIAFSRVLSMLTVGSQSKIIKDVGLSGISVFGVLTAVFVGVSLVFKEVERRTVYTLLANPIRRWQFVSGKYAGLLLVVAMNVAAMTAALSLVLLVLGESPGSLIPAVLLILVELALIAAFALLFSSFANPILATVGTLAVYVSGHLVRSFELLKARMPSGAGRVLSDVLYWVLPNLSVLDVKAEAVHGIALPAARLLLGSVYGLTYALVVLGAACAVFERRDFK